MDELDFSVEYDLNKICRSCMDESGEMNMIFDENIGDDGMSLQQMITSCTQIQMDSNDGMPNQICINCTIEISTAYAFKKKYEQSDYILREYMSRNKVEVFDGTTLKIEDHHELFEIKPEITFIESDPLVNEKYFLSLNENRVEEDDDDLIEEDEIIEGDSQDCYDDPDDDPESVPDEEEEDEMKLIEKDGDLMKEENMSGFELREDGRFYCKICARNFADRKGMNQHMRLHTGLGLKICEICNRAFTKNYHFQRHLETHKREIQCKYCESKFISHTDHKNHLIAFHIDQELSRKRKRRIKSKKIQNIVKTESDDRIIETPISHPMNADDDDDLTAICKICDNKFTRIYELRSHLKSHMDSNTFENINLLSKSYLFDSDPPIENPVEFVIQKIYAGEVQRFYQILNKEGAELDLSDSESEFEDEKESIFYEGIIKREHVCSKCNQTFDRMQKVVEHMRVAHQDGDFGEFKCSHCHKEFPNPILLDRHLKSQCENLLKKLVCEVCKEKFMWQTSLNKHIRVHHKPVFVVKEQPKEKKYECSTCKKTFFRPEHLERHTKIHNPSEKKFECTECNKKFNRKDNLRSHMRVHKTDKDDTDKHLCVYCGRSFSNSSNLIVHMRRHTGEKPYKCDMCDKGFPRSSDLQCHRRTHTGEKPCLCTICGKGFSRSNKLVRHMRIHTGVRPYECTYCDRAFTQSNDLTLHIRRHTGEKPYVCGVCGDRFIQGTALKAHQRMQGHFDDTKTSPFASISVNNPNRFTNANRVNRIGIVNPDDPRDGDAPKQVKPVKTRLKSIKSVISHSQQMTVIPEASVTDPDSSPGPSVQRIFQNINVPPYIAANGDPYITNRVLVQNFDFQTVFSIPQPFNP